MCPQHFDLKVVQIAAGHISIKSHPRELVDDGIVLRSDGSVTTGRSSEKWVLTQPLFKRASRKHSSFLSL